MTRLHAFTHRVGKLDRITDALCWLTIVPTGESAPSRGGRIHRGTNERAALAFYAVAQRAKRLEKYAKLRVPTRATGGTGLVVWRLLTTAWVFVGVDGAMGIARVRASTGFLCALTGAHDGLRGQR